MKKNVLIIVLAAVVFCLLFFPDRCKNPTKPVIEKPTKEVLKEVRKDSLIYVAADSGYKKKTQQLLKEVADVKSKLASATEMVNQFLNDADAAIDTSDKAELHAQLDLLKEANKIKDSLCSQTIAGQDSIISNQIEQIVIKDEYAAMLRESISTIAKNELSKDKYISQLRKQVRQKKFGNVFWKVAAGAAGVIIIKGALK